MFFNPNQDLICPWPIFEEKKSLIFLRFSPEFRCLNIFGVTEHMRNQIYFWWAIKKLLYKIYNLHFNWDFLSQFQKLYHASAVHTRKQFYSHCACKETISSHTEHTLNEFSHMFSQHSNFDIFNMDIQTHAEHTRKQISAYAHPTSNQFPHVLSQRVINFLACSAN
jgi:hypothetical protein